MTSIQNAMKETRCSDEVLTVNIEKGGGDGNKMFKAKATT